MSMEYPGCEPVVHVEGMASRRKRLSDEFKSLVEDQQKLFEERIKKQEKHFNERFEKQEKRLEDQQNEIKELRADLRSSRSEARKLSYCRMLNAYLNIVKFAKEDEPVAKKRRNSKQFQTHSTLASMVLFMKTVYPGKLLSANSIREYFKDADSLKDQRDRLTHPRSIVELRDEARLFSGILEVHKGKGDELDVNEIKFLDVFSKIDELCSVGVGNLRFD
jgi:hypothetical protein